MNREIKFRAWIKASERMVRSVGVDPFHVNDLDRFYWNYDQVELMQYTGLKDRQGIEIYEGDVLSFDYPERIEPTYIVKYNADNYFHLGGFDINEKRGLFCYASRFKDCQVLGNIYENPELLTPVK